MYFIKELSGIMAKYDFALYLNNSIVINSFSMNLPDTLVILVDLDHICSGYFDTLPILCLREIFTLFCPILLIISQIPVIILLFIV